MIRKMIVFAAVAALCLMGSNSFAQSLPQVEDITIAESPVNDLNVDPEVYDTLTDPAYLLSPTDTVTYSISFHVPDLTVVQNIHVKVGTTSGGAEIAEHIFVYDSTPSGGYTYSRAGSTIFLSMGDHLYAGDVYCEIFIEDGAGNTSPVTQYSSAN